MFKNPFSFKGRIRRLEFGLSYIIYIVYFAFLELLFGDVSSENEFGWISFPLVLPVLWFIFAQGAKRCHDRGNSGWYFIIPFYILIMFFGEGDFGSNRFGKNPKGLGDNSEIDQIGELDAE